MADSAERIATLPDWMEGLDHRDWLFDGHPIRGTEMLCAWGELDWTRAYVDMGPSIAGNLGPYWHVPRPSMETVHRLYPKVLTTKWLGVIREAVAATAAVGAVVTEDAVLAEREASALREQKAVEEALERAAQTAMSTPAAWQTGSTIRTRPQRDHAVKIAAAIRSLKPNQNPETSPSSQRGKG